MMRRRATAAACRAALALVCAAALAGGRAEARPGLAGPLALAVVGGEARPELLLAQRSVEREWGTTEDSVYVEVELPGWRSETAAMALSAAVPGAGQAYVGSARAWWFALAEVAGWVTRWGFVHRGRELREEASAYAGAPSDTSSRWSFERWEQASGASADELRALYARDREAFYDRIGADAQYLAGWQGDPASTRVPFRLLRDASDLRLSRSRLVEGGLWINHLVAAFDALRAARLRNVSLGHELKLRVGSGWTRGGPELSASVERSF